MNGLKDKLFPQYRIKKAKKRLKQGYDIYDKETKHWKSVDPKTNKFLKRSDHPTIQKEIDWYNSPEGAEFKKKHKLVTKNIFGKERKYYKYKKLKKGGIVMGDNCFKNQYD
jgi:hypothetical protein